MNCGEYLPEYDEKCGSTDRNGYVTACHSCKDELITKLFNHKGRESLNDDEYSFIAGAKTDQGGGYVPG